jgi:hypothetical protein
MGGQHLQNKEPDTALNLLKVLRCVSVPHFADVRGDRGIVGVGLRAQEGVIIE